LDNLRRFLVIFSAMFLIAAAVCGFLLTRSYISANREFVEPLEVDANVYDPSGNTVISSFRDNILFVVSDPENSESDLMFVLNVDSTTDSLSFLMLPKEVKYSVAATSTVGTLGDMYYTYEASKGQNMASVISAFLDIDIKYYMCVDTETFAKILNALCSEDLGVQLNIPVDMVYHNDEQGYSINFKKGTQNLKGINAVRYLQFYRTDDNVYTPELLNYYDGTDSKRLVMVQQFIEALISQKFLQPDSDFYLTNYTELLKPFLTSSETNVTEEILNETAKVLNKVSEQRINYYMLLGETEYNGRTYLIYNGYLRNLKLDEAISTCSAADIFGSQFKGS